MRGRRNASAPARRGILGLAITIVAGALVVLATGCGGDDQEGPALEGTAWTLTSGVDVSGDSTKPTLTLTDGQASGTGGCNNYNSSYELDGDSLTFGPIASTKMACPEPQMSIETAYFLALDTVDGWAIAGGDLVLSSGGSEVLRFSAGQQ